VLHQKADNLDILLVLAGYVLMHTTFIRLFLSSRSLGSNFWLTTAILSSSTLSFMVALPVANYLRIPLDPVSLIEALPFLVCTVGFEKPLRLARTVFSHPHLMQPAIQEGRLRGQMKPAPDLIMEALDKVGNTIVRDYVLEIAVLLIGAYSKVGGLKEFCVLAALLLTVDCAATATFYIAILSVMIEVRRVKMFRVLSSRRSSMSDVKPPVLVNGQLQLPKLSFRQRTSAALLGVKGSLLKSQSKEKDGKEENPVARLKLLLVRAFPLILVPSSPIRVDRLIPLSPFIESLCPIHSWCGSGPPPAGSKLSTRQGRCTWLPHRGHHQPFHSALPLSPCGAS
jgi:hydroxymethylglutaryl-CoA reductase (NADPH)